MGSKWFVALSCTALMALACSRGESAVPDAVAGPQQDRYVLDNGLEVVLLTDHRLPMVAVNLTYHVGWMHDGRYKGATHLVEHLMFRGTVHTPDDEFHRKLLKAGAIG